MRKIRIKLRNRKKSDKRMRVGKKSGVNRQAGSPTAASLIKYTFYSTKKTKKRGVYNQIYCFALCVYVRERERVFVIECT